MKKNAIVGLVLMGVSAGLTYLLAGTDCAMVENLVGKAAWYLPYAALVGGVWNLARG